MSRKKTYYTADEITNDLFTIGKQWMTTDNVEYKGAYHRYITGEIYTQSKWNSKTSKILIVYKPPNILTASNSIYRKLKPNIKSTFTSFNPELIHVTSDDIKLGYMTRYFVKKYDNETIFETNSKSFKDMASNIMDKKLYTIVELKWYISGQKTDSSNGPVKLLGVVTKNLNQIKLAIKRMPGISNKLSNPLEYYTDIDFITPTDINGLDS